MDKYQREEIRDALLLCALTNILEIGALNDIEINKLVNEGINSMLPEFFIVNHFDRPYERHVVQKSVINKKGRYIHEDLKKWNENNGMFQITSGCTNITDFGLSISVDREKEFKIGSIGSKTNFVLKVIEGTVKFAKVYESIAKYEDGGIREWQGEKEFTMEILPVEFL